MKFEYSRSSTKARWAGDFIGADTMLPVPGKVDAAAFDAEGSVKVIVSVAGAAQFGVPGRRYQFAELMPERLVKKNLQISRHRQRIPLR